MIALIVGHHGLDEERFADEIAGLDAAAIYAVYDEERNRVQGNA